MKNWIPRLVILLSVTVMTGVPAFADKPDSPGNSGKDKSQSKEPNKSSSHNASDDFQSYFNIDRRTLINNYYSESRKSGNCPPGLAKKNNGCQPPGQAKKWHKGEKFPHDGTYSSLPGALLEALGRTPEGQKVIQVGTDVLLISIATGMILDVFDVGD